MRDFRRFVSTVGVMGMSWQVALNGQNSAPPEGGASVDAGVINLETEQGESVAKGMENVEVQKGLGWKRKSMRGPGLDVVRVMGVSR